MEKVLEGRITPEIDNMKSIPRNTLVSYRKEDDRNFKTLDDQLKDMENNLLRMKIDQKYEKRALTTIDKDKNSFYSDIQKAVGKNPSLSNHLENSILESVNSY